MKKILERFHQGFSAHPWIFAIISMVAIFVYHGFFFEMLLKYTPFFWVGVVLISGYQLIHLAENVYLFMHKREAVPLSALFYSIFCSILVILPNIVAFALLLLSFTLNDM